MRPRARERHTVAHAELRTIPVAEHIMYMSAARKHHWTIEDVEVLVEKRAGYHPRYELVDGELLVTPAPSGTHQRIAVELAFRLRQYIARERLGEIRLAPGEIKLVAGNRFEPDIFVVPGVAGRYARADDPVPHPLLICEVLSASSARHDRITKRRAYQRHDVPEYWVVDPNAHAFEVWRPTDDRAQLVDTVLLWRPEGCSEPFTLDVTRFFADVADGAPLA